MENNNKQSNILPLVIIFLVIAALIGGAYWFGTSDFMKSTPEEDMTDVREEEIQEEPILVEEEEPIEEGIDEDEEDVEEVIEEESNESVVETLKLLFAQKYERRVEDINVEINQREGDYLTGGVKFAGDIAGGYVLAAKVNGAWKIVFDGNGNWTCTAVDIVDFPSSLAPECWDENTMTMVDRTAK